MRSALYFASGIALSAFAVLASLDVRDAELPGASVSREQASRVFGSHTGALAAHLIASSSLGSNGHDFLLDTKSISLCSGATFSGCGGGTCGAVDAPVFTNLVGNSARKPLPCDTKMCGDVEVTCGIFDDFKCN